MLKVLYFDSLEVPGGASWILDVDKHISFALHGADVRPDIANIELIYKESPNLFISCLAETVDYFRLSLNKMDEREAEYWLSSIISSNRILVSKQHIIASFPDHQYAIELFCKYPILASMMINDHAYLAHIKNFWKHNKKEAVFVTFVINSFLNKIDDFRYKHLRLTKVLDKKCLKLIETSTSIEEVLFNILFCHVAGWPKEFAVSEETINVARIVNEAIATSERASAIIPRLLSKPFDISVLDVNLLRSYFSVISIVKDMSFDAVDMLPNIVLKDISSCLKAFEMYGVDALNALVSFKTTAEDVPIHDLCKEYREEELSAKQLLTHGEFVIEGVEMNHCVASYYGRAARCETFVYSIRDVNNNRVATLELKENKDGKLSIAQIRGKRNSNVETDVQAFAVRLANVLTLNYYDKASLVPLDDKMIEAIIDDRKCLTVDAIKNVLLPMKLIKKDWLE